MLQEAVDKEIALVRSEGSKAFELGDHGQIEKQMKQSKDLEEFQKQRTALSSRGNSGIRYLCELYRLTFACNSESACLASPDSGSHRSTSVLPNGKDHSNSFLFRFLWGFSGRLFAVRFGILGSRRYQALLGNVSGSTSNDC